MKFIITWSESATYRTELAVTIEQLASWAAESAQVGHLGVDQANFAATLEKHLRKNSHFRSRIIAAYTNDARLLTPDQSRLVHATGQHIAAVSQGSQKMQ